MHTPTEHVAAAAACSLPTARVTKGEEYATQAPPPPLIFPAHITQAVISFTGINAVHNHAESADLRQTTKIVIAGGGGRACVRDELGETLLFHRGS